MTDPTAAGNRLDPGLVAEAIQFAHHHRVLIASDFDGVLAPLVDDPLASRALPGMIDSLHDLADVPDTFVALVSGRDLETLGLLSGLADHPEITLIGAHGAQSSRPTLGVAVSDADRSLLAELTGRLRAVLADLPTARLEIKPTSTVLHTRGTPAADAREATTRVHAVASAFPELKTLSGKDVVELTPMSCDKGSAVRALGAELGVDAIAYLGDDVTDEHVFAVLGAADLGVKVGCGDTVARQRVANPEDVRDLLLVLREARRLRQ